MYSYKNILDSDSLGIVFLHHDNKEKLHISLFENAISLLTLPETFSCASLKQVLPLSLSLRLAMAT